MNATDPRSWLITGGAGFLGSHVVEQLLDRGERVIVVDLLSRADAPNLFQFQHRPGLKHIQLDIRDTAALTACLQRERPWAVAHLAALHFIPAAMADPPLAVSVNVLGTQSVLFACRGAGVERFWFASTGDVYAPSMTAHREDDRIEPFNIYGLSKLMGEQLLRLEAKLQPATRFVIGRLFNLYGPRETNPHILPEIIQMVHEAPGRPLRLGNLWPKRDMVGVAAAARAVIEMTLHIPTGVSLFNVATGVAWSMQHIIDLIGLRLGRPLPVETDAAKLRPVEREHLQADVSRLRELLGWSPESDLETGLADLLACEGVIHENGSERRPAGVV